MHSFAIFLIICLPVFVTAQGRIIIEGIVKDKVTKEPIPYVNLGFFEEGIGTVSDINGKFKLTYKSSKKLSKLIFSHLNYQNLTINLENNSSSYFEVSMESKETRLEEVIITGSRPSYIGTKNTNDKYVGFFKAKGLGGEVGTIVKNNEKCNVKGFGINIVKNTFRRLKFRVNIYSLKRNKPKRLIMSNIYFDVRDNQEGKVLVEMESLKIETDIFVSIELLELETGNHPDPEFTYSGFLDKKSIIYYKPVSMDKWRKRKNVGLCFWLDVEK